LDDRQFLSCTKEDWPLVYGCMQTDTLYEPAPLSASADLYFIFDNKKKLCSFQTKWQFSELSYQDAHEEITKTIFSEKNITEHVFVMFGLNVAEEMQIESQALDNGMGYFYDSSVEFPIKEKKEKVKVKKVETEEKKKIS